jgi:hypothetical protein
MNISIAIRKVRIDGNIRPLVHTEIGKEPQNVTENNSEADSINCVFGREDTTIKGIVVPMTQTHSSSTL